MCLIEREGRSTGFGLIVWGRGDSNCSGSGIVRRDGDRLRLLFDGDESCAIEARAQGSGIALTGGLSSECARYYCGEGAQLVAATLARTGATETDAGGVTDLAGDPLCAG